MHKSSLSTVLKSIVFFVVLLGLLTPATGQIGRRSIAKGNVYALIIGISDYQDPAISDLAYADRDAQLFADYLQSKGGGKVPPENIKLLLNEEATISKVYAAKYWLESKAKKDDLVFFYFSGHGDVENSLYNLGFLLAHDSPNGNYLNNAIRVEDFNNMANTLSVVKGAQVVFITDACRSGNLAGADNRGRFLVGSQLSTVQKNEIRMTSCGADELSQENRAWGGGRGAFSFHLLNGLRGDADADDKDGKVTLSELRSYLETKVYNDVLELKGVKQVPLIDGPPMMKLALVDKTVDLTNIETMNASVDEGTERSIGRMQPVMVQPVIERPEMVDQDYFSQFAYISLKEDYDFKEWAKKSPYDFAKKVLKTYDFDGQREWKKNYVAEQDHYHYQLAAAIHDEVQEVINAYLQGDQKELERRQYYNANDQAFEEYEYMLHIAMGLVDESSPLYHILEVKKNYFAGIDRRLQIGITGVNDELLSTAMEYQKKALALDPNAAYIHNEIGILSKLMDQNVLAYKHYAKAIELAPSWALPKSNMASIYRDEGLYDEGLAMGREAVAAQADYLNGHINLGVNAEKKKNLLLAEQCFDMVLNENYMDINAHKGLGYVEIHRTNYDLANNYFQTAAEIARDMFPGLAHPLLDLSDADGFSDFRNEGIDTLPPPCALDPALFGARDFMAPAIYGVEQMINKNYEVAEDYLGQSIMQKSDHPVAYYYLAKIADIRENPIRKEFMHRKAKEYALTQEEFNAHAEESIESQQYTDCSVESRYKNLYYNVLENQFVLAGIYRQQQKYHDVEQMYLEAIKLAPEQIAGYYGLWNHYENQELYQQAEKTINQYLTFRVERGRQELYAFYGRMQERSINAEVYAYKAAMLSYDMCVRDRAVPAFDDDYIGLYDKYAKPTDWDGGTLVDMVDFMPLQEVIAGTNETISYAGPIPDDLYTCKQALRAIEGSTTGKKEADIYHKLAILHLMGGELEQAKGYYERCIEVDSTNISDLEELATLYYTFYRYEDGYELLRRLYDIDAIQYRQLVQLGLQTVLVGDYEAADTILSMAENVDVFENELVSEYKGLRLLLDEDWEMAKTVYEAKLLESQFGEEDILYTLSRIESQLGNIDKALTYLADAETKGFRHYWVLINDPLIESLRENKLYMGMVERYAPEWLHSKQ